MCSLESDECSSFPRLVGFRDESVAFEDRVGGAGAYLESLLVEVCGDGFMTPSFRLSELDYSLNCG